jgi:nitroreductase
MVDGLFLIENYKNVTAFNEKEVPAHILSEILNCARITPTRKHPQDWKFVVIKNDSTKTKLASITQVDCFNSAPILVAFFSKENTFYVEYTAAATQAMLIAANYYNLGTHWHIINKADTGQVNTLLNAPSEYHLMSITAFGYYNFAAPHFQKMPSLSEMTLTEKFK